MLSDQPPENVADLPTPIKERIDALVHNDMEIGTQFAAMDALLLGECDERSRESTALLLGECDEGSRERYCQMKGFKLDDR